MTPDPISAYVASVTSGGQRGPAARHNSPSATLSPRPARPGDGQSLWTAFWQDFALENEIQERCYVPGDGRHVIDRHWAMFAAGLPSEAEVIDLGCGAGTVGRTLLDQRRDLHVTGVDWANVPIMSQANLTICPRTSMEALPFDACRFDAAVSLFGIEYAAIDRTARELERVLKPGARFSFVVHHRESEIVREGSMRRRALRELTSGKMKASFLAGNHTAITQQKQWLARQFPDEPMVMLVSDHYLRAIGRTRAERQGVWQDLAISLEPEIALLLCLEKAAKTANEMATWLAALLSAMRTVSVSTLRRASGEPITWDVSGNR